MQERSKIKEILRTRHVVTREHLQRHEVSRHGDRDVQLREQLDSAGLSDNLRFDSRERKQQIEDRTGRLRRWRQPGGREPTYGFLFDESLDAVAMARRWRIRRSASASSLATATARSASLVNRGSVRAETARPPTNAKEELLWARSH